MNVEELVRESMREISDGGARPPVDLADRALAARRRRRARRVAGAAVATVAAVAVAVGVPMLDTGGGGSSSAAAPSLASERQTDDVVGRPDQSPPKDLIAAGDTALAAFTTEERVKQPDRDEVLTRTYGLLNQKTGTYEKTKEWAYLAVAPGMRTAAVLEGELPAQRIGLLDLHSGEVDRWIPVERGVGGVAFSPDGRKLVATTYDKNPDRLFWEHKMSVNGKDEPGAVPSRTGFTIVDLQTGEARWSKAPTEEDGMGFGTGRDDFAFSHDGALVFEHLSTEPHRAYYDLKGAKVPMPPEESHLSWAQAGLSPDGKRAAGEFAGEGDEIAAAINDPLTGKQLAKVPAQQLLAWADNQRIIAWGCDPKKCDGKGEFRNQLLLVTVGSDKVVPLSDFRKASDDYPSRWTPIFAKR
ncbi:YncE family protein [Streptomyces apocyni]|uniref:WD40 repeat domain-containing protein n=1 Tax=Streptomyces apocyni TaxID=2654677 RepID=UPI0012EA6E6D|nr:WD40 repeat domain-containing protein [Streptomyces apocyni]